MSPDNPHTHSTAPLSRSAIAGAVLLFLAGFAVMAALLHLVEGDTMALYGAERSEKLEILRRNDFTFSSAIFGSSHVHQGFDPRVFDATLAGTPVAVRSFNLGVDGGVIVEQRVMALEFLRHLTPPPGDKPCFVMLEANSTPTFDLYFTSNPRQINILGDQSLRLLLSFPATGYTRMTKLHHRLVAFNAAFYHAINMGMLSNRIFRPPFDEPQILRETVNDRRGVHHVPADIYGQADLQGAWSRRRDPPERLPGSFVKGHDRLIEELHSAPNGDRAQFLWVVTPMMMDRTSYEVYPSSQSTSFGDVPIFDMARPDLYPELYDRSLWVDSQHLNEQGSKIFSHLLAQQILAWSQAHPMHGCGG